MVRLAFSPDSKQLATTERDSAVRLYDIDSGNRIWSHVVKLTNIFENYTSALAFSPDGKVLAVCATDNRIYFIDPSTGEETARLAGHHWYPWAVAFTSEQQDALLVGLGCVHSSMGRRGTETAPAADGSAGDGSCRGVTGRAHAGV